MADCKLRLCEVDELLLVDGLRAAAADTEAGAAGAAGEDDEEDADSALAALRAASALAFASSS